jgi:DNA mismatch repair protein MutS2
MVVETRLLSVVAGEKPRRAPPHGDGPVAVESPAEVDLRGLTGDEAEVAAAAAIDAAVLADRPHLRIIHGKGTGVVRDRVRRLLSGDSRVESFAFAPSNQGGTGVTVVELRP